MDRKTALYFDEQLWLMIWYAANHTAVASLQIMSNLMAEKGFKDCNKNKIDRALERLQARGKIDRYWDGKKWVTKALRELYIYDDGGSSFFIDEKPIKADKKVMNICNYFLENHLIGRGHRVSMKFLGRWFDIEERKIRSIIERINFRGYIFPENFDWDYLIMGDIGLGGYFIVETEDEARMFVRQYDHKLYKASRKSRIAREKLGLDNQMSARLKEFELEIEMDYEQEYKQIKTIGDDLIIEGVNE